MARRFARLRAHPLPTDPGFSAVPSDGMCLNAFLILRAPDDPGRVLLGKIAPGPHWADAGGLDAERAARVGDRWMLPSCQLLLFESPDDAARRIAREQLGIELGPGPAPQVFSESYGRPGSVEADPHWDLHFLFSRIGPARPPRSPLWKELAYLAASETSRTSLGRGHGDILTLAGLTLAPETIP
jgi:8-oxo-dGTP pyrophosphatase MutT (NUDIX family)